MKGYFQTDPGKVRSHNEDSGGVFYNQTGQMLAVIADGMGGHQAGDVASRLATSFMQERWEKTDAFSLPDSAESWLRTSLHEMNVVVLDYSRTHEECAGMGTTVVAVICTETFFSVAHIGDSRCYILNDKGFRQITTDHSLVNELVKTGQISKEDAEEHPRKNVLLKAVGTEQNITADVQTAQWNSDNRLLLCSDGLTDKIKDDELSTILNKPTDIAAICNEMVELANARGGEDNISIIVVHHRAAAEEGDG
ncbi:protein phosphatase [Lentibacillus persicus]|uniref:protein-serine/threonine phosphatase n=1 Tax=Lentibacillus persicus TaxID=640948 RepID=A0A1I1VFH1_9BACI|nr:Stp1/IreP family PP2C-type Ser/Thr phosphatase [Lentibacillus persicus]SFD81747.1 protein phosphatase [Lentibacillus persicus]